MSNFSCINVTRLALCEALHPNMDLLLWPETYSENLAHLAGFRLKIRTLADFKDSLWMFLILNLDISVIGYPAISVS